MIALYLATTLAICAPMQVSAWPILAQQDQSDSQGDELPRSDEEGDEGDSDSDERLA
jgi:hypothetical protein